MNSNAKDILVIILEKEAITKLTQNLYSKDSQSINNEPPIQNDKLMLTPRELNVLRLITQGKNNNEIADFLKLSIHTIKADVCSILQKLNVSDRLKAAIKAVKENII